MAREQHSQSCAGRGFCVRSPHFQPFPNFVAYATKFGNGSGGVGPHPFLDGVECKAVDVAGECVWQAAFYSSAVLTAHSPFDVQRLVAHSTAARISSTALRRLSFSLMCARCVSTVLRLR